MLPVLLSLHCFLSYDNYDSHDFHEWENKHPYILQFIKSLFRTFEFF